VTYDADEGSLRGPEVPEGPLAREGRFGEEMISEYLLEEFVEFVVRALTRHRLKIQDHGLAGLVPGKTAHAREGLVQIAGNQSVNQHQAVFEVSNAQVEIAYAAAELLL
jgi:hypothetical protein